MWFQLCKGCGRISGQDVKEGGGEVLMISFPWRRNLRKCSFTSLRDIWSTTVVGTPPPSQERNKVGENNCLTHSPNIASFCKKKTSDLHLKRHNWCLLILFSWYITTHILLQSILEKFYSPIFSHHNSCKLYINLTAWFNCTAFIHYSYIEKAALHSLVPIVGPLLFHCE